MNGLNKATPVPSSDLNLLNRELRENWFDCSSLFEASCKNKVIKFCQFHKKRCAKVSFLIKF